MIADVVTSRCEEGIVFCTNDGKVLANRQITKSNLEPCSHEEANTRLFAHAQNAALTNMQKVMIRGDDTGIVVIALHIFCDLKIEQLWIEYGCGKNHQWLPIHNYVKFLGEDKCRVLSFWYTLTGWNTVSSFCGRGKKLHGMRGAVSLKLLNAF